MSTVSLDVNNAIKTCIQTVMGTEYKEMAYNFDITPNTFKNLKTQYAVQAGEVEEISGVTKYLTFSQTFRVVLASDGSDSGLTDAGSVAASFELRQKMFELYVHLINTKAGLPSRVMNVTSLNMDTPEYLDDEKVTVLRGSFNIIFRLTLT